ncbi:Flp pilus assembly complex ATPase component TadA [bacterium]|nr:Flp pilus assembly complex ATPase component TadA [bacterium]
MRRVEFEDLERFAPKRNVGAVALPLKRDEGLTPALIHILQGVQRELGQHDGETADDGEEKPLEPDYEQLVYRVSERLGFQLTSFERDQVLSQLERDARPFGVLQELVDSPDVSDIMVYDYNQVSFQRSRRTHSTQLRFPSQEAYEAFVERLLQKAGTSYSTKKPVADGMIGSFARIHAVHRSLCDTGPYLTIRLNRYSSVAVEDLLESGLAPQPVLHYLSLLIRGGHTAFIVGEVGTGKTTLARALAGTIPQEDSILVIEDTPEIRLEHSQTRYMTTREANMDGEGRVTPAQCIRAGMRMAMNRIIFGEIRDAEAAEAFIDVCSSGHPGLSTIHAKSASDAITRLELFLGRAQRGVGKEVLTQQIGTAVQVIIFVNICRRTGRRRIMEVTEVGAAADGVLRQRDIFAYQKQGETPQWKVLAKSSQFRADLERGDDALFLSQLPNTLELDPAVAYAEAAAQGDSSATQKRRRA